MVTSSEISTVRQLKTGLQDSFTKLNW